MNQDEIIYHIKTCQNEIRLLDFDEQDIDYYHVEVLATEFLQYAKMLGKNK